MTTATIRGWLGAAVRGLASGVAAVAVLSTLAAVLVLVVAAATVSPAQAETPAGDTESIVTAVDPPTPVVTVRILGGDETVLIAVEPGHEVVVTGYAGESYLRIDTQGTVFENQRSPAVAANADRYNTTEPAAEADDDAPPDWREVGAGGRFEWHDHRMHWMVVSVPPPGGPGDTVFTWTIPLLVDGTATEVRGLLRQGEAAEPWLPIVVGVVAGGAALILGTRAAGRFRVATVLVTAGIVTTLAAGLVGAERVALASVGWSRPFDLVPVLLAGAAVVVLAVGRTERIRMAAAAATFVVLSGWLLAWARVTWKPVVVSALPEVAARAAVATAAALLGVGLVLTASYWRHVLDAYASRPPSARVGRARRGARG